MPAQPPGVGVPGAAAAAAPAVPGTVTGVTHNISVAAVAPQAAAQVPPGAVGGVESAEAIRARVAAAAAAAGRPVPAPGMQHPAAAAAAAPAVGGSGSTAAAAAAAAAAAGAGVPFASSADARRREDMLLAWLGKPPYESPSIAEVLRLSFLFTLVSCALLYCTNSSLSPRLCVHCMPSTLELPAVSIQPVSAPLSVSVPLYSTRCCGWSCGSRSNTKSCFRTIRCTRRTTSGACLVPGVLVDGVLTVLSECRWARFCRARGAPAKSSMYRMTDIFGRTMLASVFAVRADFLA